MKELTYELLARATRCVCDEAEAVVLPRQGISSFHKVNVQNATLLSLPHNHLRNIDELYTHFASVWWIDVSYNQLSRPFTNRTPFAFGLLAISGNDIPLQNLSSLSSSYIIRLQYTAQDATDPSQLRHALLQLLPNVWVINDDFVSSQEKTAYSLMDKSPLLPTLPKSGDWSSVPALNSKEQDFMHLINHMPTSKALMEFYKLDVVLDDYISCEKLFDEYASTSVPLLDIDALLLIPHKSRIDLSVLLTASIYFSLPENTFHEALLLLLASHMKSADIAVIPTLPLFVRTAMICLIRRICRKELRDLQVHKRLSQKPKKSVYISDDEGFNHLKTIRHYLNRPNDKDTFAPNNDGSNEEFADIELQILQQLPDIPTHATCPTGVASYRDWMSLTARHTVLLLKRAPSCPSLTTAPNTKTCLDVYVKLIPLLEAAGMTFNALEIVTTGPHVDGRLHKPVAATEGLNDKIKRFEHSGRGKVLAYGAGVPTGIPKQLVWNQPEMLSSMRNYEKPWAEMRVSMDDEVSQSADDFVKSMEEKYLNDAMSDGGSKDLSRQVSEGSTRSTAGHITHASVTYRSRASSPNATMSHFDTNTTLSMPIGNDSGIIKFRPPTPCGQGTNKSKLQRIVSSRTPGAEERQLMNILHHTLAGRPSAVCGYSADADLQASFILASQKKVSMHNSIVHDDQLRLNDLASPPVLLHPRAIVNDAIQPASLNANSIFEGERDESDIFADPDTARSQHSHASAASALESSRSSIFKSLNQASKPKLTKTITPPPEVETLSLSQFRKLRRNLSTNSKTHSMADSLTSSSTSLGLSTGRNDDFEITPDMTEEDIQFFKRQHRRLEKRKLATHRWLNNFQGDLAASERGAKDYEMESLLAKIEEADVTLSNAVKGIIRHESGDFSYMRADSDDDISTALSQRANEEEIDEVNVMEEARKQLLKEMGTTKNILRLSDDNRRLTSNMKKMKGGGGSQKTITSAPSASSKMRSPEVSQSMPSLTWKTFVKKPQSKEIKKATKQQHDSTFLTSNPLENSCPPVTHALKHADSGDLMAPINTPMMSRGQSPHTPALQLASTNVGLTRATLQYDRVYNNSHDIEWGVTAPNGRVIVPTWYPLYNKVMYTLDPLAKEYKVVTNTTARNIVDKHQPSPTRSSSALAPTQYHPPGLDHVPPVLYGPANMNSNEIFAPHEIELPCEGAPASEFKLVFRARTPEKRPSKRRSSSPNSAVLHEDSITTSKRHSETDIRSPRTEPNVTTADSTSTTELDVSLRVAPDANAIDPSAKSHIAHPLKTTYRKQFVNKPTYAQLDPATFGKPKPSIPLVKPIKNTVKLNPTFKNTIPRPLPPDVLYEADSVTSSLSRHS